MRIGVPAEIRAGDTRVAATPETVKKLAAKNEVRIQTGAGAASSYRDGDYEAAGATLVGSAAQAYDADIVLKVTEAALRIFDRQVHAPVAAHAPERVPGGHHPTPAGCAREA